MSIKKFISAVLAAVMTLSSIPVISFAKDEEELPIDAEALQKEIGAAVEYSGFDAEATQEPYSNEPEEHTEVVSKDMELPEVEGINNDEYGISLFASTNNSDIWNTLMTDRFGDAYLAPWKQTDGQTVSGNSNRLVIRETDLRLPGKNGLDVVIRRRHDNQYYNEIYSAYLHPLSDGYMNVYNLRNIYAFKNSDTNDTVYVGFMTVDDFYTYMEHGITISALPSRTHTVNNDGSTLRFYYFEDIYLNKSSSGITLTYDSSIPSVRRNAKYESATRYSIFSRPLLNNKNRIGETDWSLEMPEACIYAYDYEKDSYRTGETWWYNYVGAFRDIDGGVYEFEGVGKFVDPDEGESTYTSSFFNDNNKYLSMTQYLTMQTLPGTSISYNFTVEDSGRGLTYYMNNIGVSSESVAKTQRICMAAVRDRFGNTIKYEYDSTNSSVIAITDTYGRRISLDGVTNGKEISYTDENNKKQTIKYSVEELSASSLNNDSPLKSKPVERLKVTNAAGETTMYDSRDTVVLNFLCIGPSISLDAIPAPYGDPTDISTNSNVERIIYPTGAETRYRYKCVYVTSDSTKVAHGVYAVEDSYDIIDNVVKNHKSYDLKSSYGNVTKTETDQSKGSKTVYSYDTDGLLTKSVLSPVTGSMPYVEKKYTYAKDNQLTSVEENNSGVKTTVSYSHSLYYPGSLGSETVGDKQITYIHHTIGGKLTDLPEQINVQYKSGSDYVTDYSIETTLDSSGRAIEYVRTVQNDKIVEQKKLKYDSYGQIESVTEWSKDANSDGVLDENDDPVVNNSYNQQWGNGHYIDEWTEDVKDVDGADTGLISTLYMYGVLGNLYSVAEPNGAKTEIEYDGTGRPVKFTYDNGAEETIEYNTSGKRTETTDKTGKRMRITYDGAGNPKYKYFYESGWKMLMSCGYDNSGRLSYVNNYRSSGKYEREQYTYDILDRVVSKKVYSNTTPLYTENYAYTVSGGNSIVTKTTSALDNTAVAVEKETCDNLGRLIKKTASDGDEEITASYTYDYRGNMISETDANGNKTEYEYDFKDRLTWTFEPGFIVTFRAYDMMGRKIIEYDRDRNMTRYTYDKLGRELDSKKNMTGKTVMRTKKYYDKNSNIIKESIRNNVQEDTSGDTFRTTEYVYDRMNNLIGTKVNDGSKTSAVQYWYDTAGRMTAMASGLSSINASSASPSGGSVTQYEYDTRGFLSKETDPLGQSSSYTYDYTGNVLTSTDRNGTVTTNEYGPYGVTFSEAVNGNIKELYANTYNSMGMTMVSKLYNNGTLKDSVASTYDAFGRKLTETSSGKTNKYSYDGNSNVVNYQLLSGTEVESNVDYTYDGMNWLTKADFDGIMVTYTYTRNGCISTKKIGDITTTIGYNYLDYPVSYVTKTGDNVVSSFTYTYSADGNRLSDNDTVNNINRAYEYDGAGRLVKETQSGAEDRTVSYTYDLRGNRTKETTSGSENYVITNTYDANDRLTNRAKTVDGSAAENVKYYYDANGNQTCKQTYNYSQGGLMSVQGGSYRDGTVETFTYDLQNRLTGYQNSWFTASYAYGANGLRKSKTTNGNITPYVWDRGRIVADLWEDKVANLYYYGADGIAVRKYCESEEINVHLKNVHGDVMGVTDERGYVIERYRYDAFGNNLTDDTTEPFGYCGEYFDDESGLVYLRNRYYDPETGRFITEDPAKDGVNWYSYCNGNPISFIDPSGYSYDEVINALDSIYSSKNIMNHTTPGNRRYNNALENAKANKTIIKNSDVYIENWGELTPILSPLLNGSSNSLESIAEMKNAVQNAKSAYIRSENTDSLIFVVTTAAAMVTAIKGGRAILGAATASTGILPLTTSVDPNKLNHVFGKAQHGLSDFLSLYNGNQTKAYNAIRNAAQIVINNNGVTNAIYKSTDNPIIVDINGFVMQVGGAVVDGIFHLGTVFIKK